MNEYIVFDSNLITEEFYKNEDNEFESWEAADAVATEELENALDTLYEEINNFDRTLKYTFYYLEGTGKRWVGAQRIIPEFHRSLESIFHKVFSNAEESIVYTDGEDFKLYSKALGVEYNFVVKGVANEGMYTEDNCIEELENGTLELDNLGSAVREFFPSVEE